jgi:hypothetical protein
MKELLYPLDRRLGVSRVVLDILEKRGISCFCWDLKPRLSSM